MRKFKKIFIGILSMVLLVGGTVNNVVAKEYVTGTKGGITFKISYSGSVSYTASAFYNFNATMSSTAYYRYENMDMYMILYRNAESNYTKSPSGTNTYTLSSSLQGTEKLTGTAYLKSHAQDSLYGTGTSYYTFNYNL